MQSVDSRNSGKNLASWLRKPERIRSFHQYPHFEGWVCQEKIHNWRWKISGSSTSIESQSMHDMKEELQTSRSKTFDWRQICRGVPLKRRPIYACFVIYSASPKVPCYFHWLLSRCGVWGIFSGEKANFYDNGMCGSSRAWHRLQTCIILSQRSQYIYLWQRTRSRICWGFAWLRRSTFLCTGGSWRNPYDKSDECCARRKLWQITSWGIINVHVIK